VNSTRSPSAAQPAHWKEWAVVVARADNILNGLQADENLILGNGEVHARLINSISFQMLNYPY